MSVLPQKVGTQTSSIYPSNEKASSILPDEVNNRSNFIGATDMASVKSSGMMWLSVIAVCIAIVYGVSHVNFAKTFEDEWSRVESSGGTYYELVLDVQDGEMIYGFDSWLIDSTIARYEYFVIGPGMVVVNNNWDEIIMVKIDGDTMRFSPALTSPNNYEYWYK